MKNDSGPNLGLIVAGLAVVAGGVYAGYHFLGANNDTSKAPVVVASNDSDQIAPAPAPTPKPLPAAAGEYTAPGAPDISIQETKPVTKPKATKPDPNDSESTETGLPIPPPDSSTPSDATPDPNATSSGTQDNSSPDTSTTPTQSPDSTNTSATTNPPTDTTSSAGNPSSIAQPPAPIDTLAVPQILYHVLAGTFHDERNAKVLADALKHRGYSAITVKNTSGSTDAFIVQIGAYRSKITADETADELQRNGFPATVTHG